MQIQQIRGRNCDPVKPNFRPSAFLKAKALGFTRSLIDVLSLEKVSFFYDLEGFGGIRSTQPTMSGQPSLTDN